MTVLVDVTPERVAVRFTGRDRWLCLSSGVELAAGEITAARVASRRQLVAELRWRVGGGYWPGRLTTGWFTTRGRNGDRQLWAVYGDGEVLAIDTTRPRPCRVVLQHPDRHQLAAQIDGVRSGGSSS